MENNLANPTQSGASALSAQQQSGRIKFLLILLVCAAPLLLSYLTYYVIKPGGRTNYGALIDPREHPIPPALGLTTLDGKPVALAAYEGKWVMLQSGPCQAACHQDLTVMRQLRLMQGKDMDRLARVWLITDPAPLDIMLMREFDGTDMLRAPAAALKAWLPVAAGDSPAGHLYLIDPRGHLMMRFPKNPEPSKVKKDIGKLLKASAIG